MGVNKMSVYDIIEDKPDEPNLKENATEAMVIGSFLALFFAFITLLISKGIAYIYFALKGF